MLGVSFGALCFAGFSSNQDMPAEFAKWQVWSWSNTMMWSTISNRFLLGVVVAMAGFITVHPMCNLKLSAWLRGMKIGFLVSLPMAIGALMGEDAEMAKQGFWLMLIMGTVIGSIIDMIITKVAGQGDDLIINK
jgi:predicted membrane protein